MISDYDKGGLRAPSIDTVAKSLKSAWIPRLLSVEEKKAISNYLLDKYGELNFLLRCNYDKKFSCKDQFTPVLQRNPSAFPGT